jgi:hypothetical protein
VVFLKISGGFLIYFQITIYCFIVLKNNRENQLNFPQIVCNMMFFLKKASNIAIQHIFLTNFAVKILYFLGRTKLIEKNYFTYNNYNTDSKTNTGKIKKWFRKTIFLSTSRYL